MRFKSFFPKIKKKFPTSPKPIRGGRNLFPTFGMGNLRATS